MVSKLVSSTKLGLFLVIELKGVYICQVIFANKVGEQSFIGTKVQKFDDKAPLER